MEVVDVVRPVARLETSSKIGSTAVLSVKDKVASKVVVNSVLGVTKC